MNWSKKDILNICKVVAFGIILFVALNNIGIIGNALGRLFTILLPFILGVAIAFVLNIPMTIFEKKIFVLNKNKKRKKGKNEQEKISKGKRLICILISLIIIILIIIGIIYLVIPEIISAIGEMVSYIPQLYSKSKDLINELIIKYPEVETTLESLQSSLENISSEMIKDLTTLGTSLISSSFGVISSTVSMVIKIVIAIIFAIYILMDKEKIFSQLKRITYAFFSEKTANKICEIATISKNAFYNFVTGQFTECIILGSLCAIGMLIMRLPYSATVGVLVGVTAFIPIVGAFIGGLIGVILLIPVSFSKAMIFLVFFIILQQIENNIIYPRIVGNSVGVPGFIVLIAITLGGAFWGVAGMIISLPLTSVVYTLIREATNKRLREKNKKTLEY